MKLGKTIAFCAVLTILALAPASAGALEDAKAGNAAAKAGRFTEAVELFTKAIGSGKLKGTVLAMVYNNRAFAYNELRRYDKAILDAKQALKIDPEHANAYNNMGNAYRRQRQFAQAIENYSQAILLHPKADYFANRCLARGQNKEIETAIADCEKALSIEANHRAALNILAILRRKSK